MNNTIIQLIAGTFEPNDATRILSGVLNSKINFHKLDDFSNHVRFDGAISSSKKRVDELQNAQQEVLNLVEYAKQNGKKIKIKSDIIIELLD